MIRFIDVFKDRFGIEPIRITLPVGSVGSSLHVVITTRKHAPARTGVSQCPRDWGTTGIREANYSVYGVRKIDVVVRWASREMARN